MAAPAERIGATVPVRQERLLIVWSWRPAVMRTFKSVGSHLGEENDSTGHETVILRKCKVTAWIAGQLQLLTAIRAADNLEEVRDRGREGQASRNLDKTLVQTRYSS